MNKVINGKMYNTETAKLIGETSYGQCNDFIYWCEQLYQKKTGEFFLLGDGNALSKYSAKEGNETFGISKIIPLSEDEAKSWVEEYLSGDSYCELFGTPEE